MELGKYKLAMRPKKYLTREFVVYKAAPEAMDDVITEEQNTIDTMPSQTPAMDNYMPEFPGMEDPSLRQVELADGGVVQREGFGKGSVPPGYITGKELEELTGIPNLAVKAKELMYAPKEYKRQKNLFGDFYKKQLKAKYFDIGQGGKYGTLHYKKPTAEQIQIMREYHLRKGAKYGVSKATADRMKLFHNDPKLRNYVRNGKLIPDELLKQYGITRNEAAQSIFRLAQAYNGKKFANVDVGIPKNKSAGKKLFDQIDRAPFGNPYKMAAYKEALNVITDGIGDKYFETTTFENMKREARRILQKEKIPVFDPTTKGSKGINVNELTGITASSRNKSFPYSQFINLMEGNLNTKAYAGFNKQFEKYEKNLQNEIAKGNKGNPNKIIKEYKNYTKDFLGGLEDIDKAQIEKLGLPELSLKEPTELYGKKRTAELLSQGLDLPASYKELKYSIKVPKGTATLKEFISDKNIRDKIISELNPKEKKAMSNFGTKLSSFGGGVDPDTIKQAIETLPAKQRNLIFGAASKLRGASNLGLAAAAELTTGSTPLGVAITALLSAPILIDKLGEGYSLGQSLQDVGSMLTFDAIKEMDVDRSMIEKYGGPIAAEGYDIKNTIEEITNIEDKLLQLDEEQNRYESDPQYARLVGKEELFRIQRRRKVLQDELADKQKQYEAISDKFEKFTAFKDIEKYPELEKNIRKSEDVLYEPYSLDETVMGFDDPRDEEQAEKTIKAKKLLKQFEYKKPKQPLQPLGFLGGVNTYKAIPTEELMNQYLAYGGRVGLKDAGDPKDKPILPINPMIGGEDPRGQLQDPGRRDVLKGMGLLGAGVAAGKLGLLKLGKAIKKAPLTNIVKPMGKTMTQFPKWFPTLMNRIRKEGTQIPIFKTKEVNISKQEYDALKQQGTKNLFDRYIGRTENYVNELKQQGIPRYYQKVNTDEIIGYQYEVKDLPNVRVTDLAGKEIRIDFPNAYGKDVTMTYKAPKVSVDMQGKQVKYDAEFQVDDAVPESGGYPGDVPDFYGEIVNNLDEVYGGASQIEQYALKLKKPRTTQGDEVVNAWDAGQPHMSVKEMRELELKKQKKQGRRDYAKQQVDEKPATFEDREFLKNFLDAGEDID